MFKISPEIREELESYIRSQRLVGLMPFVVCSLGHDRKGYRWDLTFIEYKRVQGKEDEFVFNVDGIDFVIDCSEVFKDDLRERTLVKNGRRFEFEIID